MREVKVRVGMKLNFYTIILLWKNLKNEMGGACSTYGKDSCIQDFGLET